MSPIHNNNFHRSKIWLWFWHLSSAWLECKPNCFAIKWEFEVSTSPFSTNTDTSYYWSRAQFCLPTNLTLASTWRSHDSFLSKIKPRQFSGFKKVSVNINRTHKMQRVKPFPKFVIATMKTQLPNGCHRKPRWQLLMAMEVPISYKTSSNLMVERTRTFLLIKSPNWIKMFDSAIKNSVKYLQNANSIWHLFKLKLPNPCGVPVFILTLKM